MLLKVDYNSEEFKQKEKEIEKSIIKNPLSGISIPYLDIKYLNTSKVLNEFYVSSRFVPQSELRNKFTINFFGFPKEDGRLDFELDLIRNYVKKLYSQVPHLFYYLGDCPFGRTKFIFLSLASINYIYKVGSDIDKIEFFKEETQEIAGNLYKSAVIWDRNANKTESNELKAILQKAMLPLID